MSDTRQVSVAQLREWAEAVLRHVSIHNVRLKALDAESANEFLDGPFSVTSELSFVGHQVNETVIETASFYEVTSRSETGRDDEESTAWRVKCDVRAEFHADGPEALPTFDQDELDAFAMLIGVIHIHPYARETVQSLSGRMGYPPFTLEGLTPITAWPDEELVNFGSQ